MAGEDLKILAEDIIDFLNGVEASVVKFRRQIEKLMGEAKPSVKLPFDAGKINWQKREGAKGEFEVSEDYNNPEHKALLKFLNEHAGGCVNSEGWFYWVYRNGSTVGRKKREVKR
ncbi:MAG: hypothetical protein QXN36_01245 [Candidatus Bathyarchaeia archaeon]